MTNHIRALPSDNKVIKDKTTASGSNASKQPSEISAQERGFSPWIRKLHYRLDYQSGKAASTVK